MLFSFPGEALRLTGERAGRTLTIFLSFPRLAKLERNRQRRDVFLYLVKCKTPQTYAGYSVKRRRCVPNIWGVLDVLPKREGLIEWKCSIPFNQTQHD
jgi:hypothetical protein